MDNEVTAPTGSAPTLARRRLFGVGLGGAASLLPVLAGRAAASSSDTTTADTVAATTTTAPPKRPTSDDVGVLAFAQSVELAARNLYDVALGGDLPDMQRTVLATLRQSHTAYADSIAGLLGRQAPNTPHPIAKELAADFSGGGVLDAAYALEATAVATHTDLLGRLEGTDGAALLASILVVEARHGTVLADLSGTSDLARLLVDEQPEPLSPEA